MELFIPGLIVLLVSAFFAFMVVPRMGSMILFITCLLALIAAGIHHYALFSNEYRLSTWQYALASYGPMIVLALAIMFIIAALMAVFTGGSISDVVATPAAVIQTAATNAVAVLPSANSATNAVTASINRALNTNANKPKSLIPALGYAPSNV